MHGPSEGREKLGVNLKVPHLLEELWGLHPWGGTERQHGGGKEQQRCLEDRKHELREDQEEQREGGQHPGDIQGVYTLAQMSQGGCNSPLPLTTQ